MPDLSRLKKYLRRPQGDDAGQPQDAPKPTIKKPTAFIHIPKTGAAALSNYLRNKLDAQNTLTINSRRELAYMRDDELAQHDYFNTHTSAMILRRLPECHKITLLRDPLERVVASYVISRNDPRDTMITRQARQLSLYEFVSSDHPTILAVVENVQVKRIILNLPDTEQAYATFLTRLTSDELIERARESLDQIDVVGRLQNIDLMLKQLRDLYEWDSIEDFQYTESNLQRVDSDNIEPRVKNVIRQRTKLDQLLYEEVRARFG